MTYSKEKMRAYNAKYYAGIRPEMECTDAPNSVNRAVFDRFSADVRLWRLA